MDYGNLLHVGVLCIVGYVIILGVCFGIFVDYVMLNVIGHPVHVVIRSELGVKVVVSLCVCVCVCVFACAVCCMTFSLTYDNHTL